MALQCSYVCMCHMCSHMCGHMGSCVLDILQGIGTAGAGTVSQAGSRMPNNPLLCNYGLLKKSNIHPEETNSFHAFQLFSLQHWPGCDSKLMNSVLLALSPITFHSTEFNICLLNGSQSQYTDSVWAARGERFSLSEILLKEAVTQKSNPESFIKKTKILMPPPRRLKRRHLSYKTGSFSILLWCGLLFCGHLERWLRTGDGVTKLFHCCVFSVYIWRREQHWTKFVFLPETSGLSLPQIYFSALSLHSFIWVTDLLLEKQKIPRWHILSYLPTAQPLTLDIQNISETWGFWLCRNS